MKLKVLNALKSEQIYLIQYKIKNINILTNKKEILIK